MKKGLTEMVFILDKSGSMHGLEKDTIGGFNSMIEKQKKEDGEAFINTVLFSNRSEVLHDRVELEKVPLLTDKDYKVGGSTALLDALGRAIKHISNIHKYARAEDVPEHTVFVITTDGMENASREFSREEIRSMIKQKQEEQKWEFIFMGANIDAITTAESYGIPHYMAANYHADHHGTEMAFACLSRQVSMARNNVADTDRTWAEDIDEDYNNRK